jgi:hypothetical protein
MGYTGKMRVLMRAPMRGSVSASGNYVPPVRPAPSPVTAPPPPRAEPVDPIAVNLRSVAEGIPQSGRILVWLPGTLAGVNVKLKPYRAAIDEHRIPLRIDALRKGPGYDIIVYPKEAS